MKYAPYTESMKNLISAVLAIVLTGCVATSIEYKPVKVDRDQAFELLERSLRLQYRKLSARTVEVTDKYFKTTRTKYSSDQWVGGITASEKAEFVYYDNVKSIKLYEKGSYYLVELLSGDGIKLYHYGSQQRSEAEDFANAMESLR